MAPHRLIRCGHSPHVELFRLEQVLLCPHETCFLPNTVIASSATLASNGLHLTDRHRAHFTMIVIFSSASIASSWCPTGLTAGTCYPMGATTETFATVPASSRSWMNLTAETPLIVIMINRCWWRAGPTNRTSHT